MKKFPVKLYLSIVFLLGSCAVLYPVRIEVTKNPSPITKENEQSLRSIKSIAVAPFAEEKSVSDGWGEEVIRILEGGKISLEKPDMVKLFLERIKKSIEEIPEEERPRIAQRIGRALKADAVLIGNIIPLGQEDNKKVSLELFHTSTGKALWWQTLDLSVKKGSWESSKKDAIKRIIPHLLGQLPSILGTSERLERPEPKKPIIDISPM